MTRSINDWTRLTTGYVCSERKGTRPHTVDRNDDPDEVYCTMTGDAIKALDLAQQGKWDEAHELVQIHSDPMSCLIHGYLHRVEGDLSNARYWYKRAGEAMPDNTLAMELHRLYELARATH